DPLQCSIALWPQPDGSSRYRLAQLSQANHSAFRQMIVQHRRDPEVRRGGILIEHDHRAQSCRMSSVPFFQLASRSRYLAVWHLDYGEWRHWLEYRQAGETGASRPAHLCADSL